MKALRASILVLALSVCAYAGNMQNDIAGNMQNDAADPITVITLNVLQSVLSLI